MKGSNFNSLRNRKTVKYLFERVNITYIFYSCRLKFSRLKFHVCMILDAYLVNSLCVNHFSHMNL